MLEKLSAEEVARRWLKLYPPADIREDPEALEKRIAILAQDEERIQVLRERLGSISWFMKSISEYIARRANREDDCKGRFWEGRFQCQKLQGQAAILSCAVYVDLNPIRAKIADRPETSSFTGAFERIEALKKAPEPHLWLAPIQTTEQRQGFLDISLPTYLEILDASGRQIREGKSGAIPEHLKPILQRLGVNPDNWDLICQNLSRHFGHAIGSRDSLKERAKTLGKAWLKGMGPSRKVFT